MGEALAKCKNTISKILSFTTKKAKLKVARELEINRNEMLDCLSGNGIEIGALHRPVKTTHLNVKYVDRMNNEELILQYPELKDLALVNVDIIDDAESLKKIKSNSQDFVIANHVIEHMISPIEALLTWQRVLKPKGKLFLAVPDKNYTFDKGRDYTDFEHLYQDYVKPSKEKDYKHFEEFALHASCRTFKVRPEAEYKELAKELWDKEYSIHYHVWDFKTFNEFLSLLPTKVKEWEMKIISKMPTKGEEFIYVLEKN